MFRTLSLTCLARRKGVPISFADLEQFLIGCSQLEVIICLLEDWCIINDMRKGFFIVSCSVVNSKQTIFCD